MRNMRPTVETHELCNWSLCRQVALFVSLIGMSVLVLEEGLVNASNGATVVGQVIFTGTVPAPQTVEVTQNVDFCGASVSIQNLVVDSSSKGVQGVVVNVEGLANSSGKTSPSIPSELRNRDCVFVPRISTVIAKARLHITNEDPVMHNTHIHQGARTFVNVAQVPGGRTFKKPVKRPGVLQAKCDKHEFMKAYVLVFDHPFHSVTNITGHFQITGVPPGPQELTMWHETLGTIHTTVEVPQGGEVSVTVEYPNK